ncbi:uncharacterized protein [Lolium perenne]|uniref:uncharacterized protein isoform X2 n=1 Tax=Lolium perenne TaxID=4522 RepID=UPI0021F658BD|nr:uncharacterized protein LOC127327760 isoform X2 [Lolium perenne]
MIGNNRGDHTGVGQGSAAVSSINNESRRLDAEKSALHQHFKEHESSPMSFPPESQEFVMSYCKTTQAKPNDLIEMTTCTVHPSVDHVVGSSNFSHAPATNHVSKIDNGIMTNGDRGKKPPSISVTAKVRSPEIDFSFDQKQHRPECLPLSENVPANESNQKSDISATPSNGDRGKKPPSTSVTAKVRSPEIDFSFDQKQHRPECLPLSENVPANESNQKSDISATPSNGDRGKKPPSTFVAAKVRSPEIDFSFHQKQHVPECPPLSENVSANGSNQKSDILATPSNGKPFADYAFMRVSNVNVQTQPKVPLQPLAQQPKVLNKKESAAKGDLHLDSDTPISVHVASSTNVPRTEKRADAALSYTEANPSSAADAMKEAMEYADARLRAAKELMERKGDSFKIRKKPSHHRSTRSVEIKAPVEVYTFEENMSMKNPAKGHNFVLDKHQGNAVRTNHCDDSGRKVLPFEKPKQMMRTCTMPCQNSSKLEKLGNWRSGDEFFELTGDDQKCQTDTARGEEDNCGTSKTVTEPRKVQEGKVEVTMQDSDLGRHEKPRVVNYHSDLEVKHESRKEDNTVQLDKGEDMVSAMLEASTEYMAHKGIDSSHCEELVTVGNSEGSHDDGSVDLPSVSKVSPELDFIKDVPSSRSTSSSVNYANDLKHLGNSNMSSVEGTLKEPEKSEGGLEVRCDYEIQSTSGSSKTLQEPPEVADVYNSQASQIKSLILEELERSDLTQTSPRVESTSELEAETYGREKFSFIGESYLHNENEIPCESLISEVEKVETEVELHPHTHTEESVPDEDVKCTEQSDITLQTNNPVVSSVLNVFEVASKLIKGDVDQEIQGSLGPSEVEDRTEEGTDRPVSVCERKEAEETPSENNEKTDTEEESAHANQEDQKASVSDTNKGQVDVDARGKITVDKMESVISFEDEITMKSANDCPTIVAINSKDEPAFCPEMSTDVQHLTQNAESAISQTSNENVPDVDKTKEVRKEAVRELPTEISRTSEEEKSSASKMEGKNSRERISKAEQKHQHVHLEKNDSVPKSAESSFPVSAEVSRKETPGPQRSKERGSTKSEKEREDREAAQRLEEAKERQKIFEKERENAEDSERKRKEEQEREREREKDKLAVERATREAHERAFNNAREMAEKMALERIAAARQRASAEARQKEERANAEARIKAERAAVERATAEARERAIKKAKAEKAAAEARERREQIRSSSKDIRQDTHSQRATSSGSLRNPDSSSKVVDAESGLRHKARIERHQRTTERVSKALAEKNMRDLMVQREQAEKHRMADFLDPEVKRWSNGKEGNLRALLSTLQYILGADSGWQPVPLTDLITAAAVKKAYRKATLCVHPDKLQQRGATIRQKYICEKVFDLLKDAWNKFTSEER